MTDASLPPLDPGERILWQGAPTARLLVFRPIDAFLVPFSLLWTGIVAFIALGGGLASPFPANAMLSFFLLIGLYFTIGRFVADAWHRRRTSYVLTDRRALIVEGGIARRLREQPLHRALAISLKGSDRGSVTFGDSRGWQNWRNGFEPWNADDGSFTFRSIEAPETVYHLAREARERLGTI
jgi:hypothetical protein